MQNKVIMRILQNPRKLILEKQNLSKSKHIFEVYVYVCACVCMGLSFCLYVYVDVGMHVHKVL